MNANVTVQFTGFRTTYTGLLRNVRAKERKNKDGSKQWVENLLDLEHEANDGRPVFAEIRLSKAAVESGLFAKMKGLVGKTISFNCVSQERIYNNKIYRDWFYAQSELPQIVAEPKSGV